MLDFDALLEEAQPTGARALEKRTLFLRRGGNVEPFAALFDKDLPTEEWVLFELWSHALATALWELGTDSIMKGEEPENLRPSKELYSYFYGHETEKAVRFPTT